MRHRKIGNVAVVKLDDYARWFEEADAETKPAKPDEQVETSVVQEPPAERQPRSLPGPGASERQRRAEFKARMQREVIENMRRKGFDV